MTASRTKALGVTGGMAPFLYLRKRCFSWWLPCSSLEVEKRDMSSATACKEAYDSKSGSFKYTTGTKQIWLNMSNVSKHILFCSALYSSYHKDNNKTELLHKWTAFSSRSEVIYGLKKSSEPGLVSLCDILTTTKRKSCRLRFKFANLHLQGIVVVCEDFFHLTMNSKNFLL